MFPALFRNFDFSWVVLKVSIHANTLRHWMSSLGRFIRDRLMLWMFCWQNLFSNGHERMWSQAYFFPWLLRLAVALVSNGPASKRDYSEIDLYWGLLFRVFCSFLYYLLLLLHSLLVTFVTNSKRSFYTMHSSSGTVLLVSAVLVDTFGH